MSECPKPSGLSNPKHPIWRIIGIGLIFVGVNVTILTLLLVKNASKFDDDELKNIGEFAMSIAAASATAFGVYKSISGRRSRRNGGEDTES